MRGSTPRRRIFVGDIQGCSAELERLLEVLRFDPARDELHPVGDLVNRGPDSLGVLRLLRRLDAGGVLGNHDRHLLRVSAGLARLKRSDTLDAVLGAADRAALLAWLRARPLVRAWDDILLVHAGLSPAWSDPVVTLSTLDPLADDERVAFATEVRHCDPTGRRPRSDWPPPPPPYAPWFRQYRAASRDPRTVVWGHWARQGLVVEAGLRGLDTGCVWGGQLSAWIAEEDRLVQVAAARRYASA